jgi:hypothetical protein
MINALKDIAIATPIAAYIVIVLSVWMGIDHAGRVL